jgi:hypothetical protein
MRKLQQAPVDPKIIQAVGDDYPKTSDAGAFFPEEKEDEDG